MSDKTQPLTPAELEALKPPLLQDPPYDPGPPPPETPQRTV